MAVPRAATVLISPAAGPIVGTWDLPGDRPAGLLALACASLALGRSRIQGLADTAECAALVAALRALGVGIDRSADGYLLVQGRGVGGLAEPDHALDTGGSDAVAALLLGLTSTHPLTVTIGGPSVDEPLPAGLVDSLSRIGVRLALRSGGRLPGTVTGAIQPLPASHRADGGWGRAALLLAGLNIPGRTTIHSNFGVPQPIDGLLGHFGAKPGGVAYAVEMTGYAELSARSVSVPGDAELAGLALLAALARPGGSVTLKRVATGRLGYGLLPALKALGAEIDMTCADEQDGLAVADLSLHPSPLTGASIDLSALSVMEDDLPFLLVAAALAAGQTRLIGGAPWQRGLDRIVPAFMAAGLPISRLGDDLLVDGGKFAGGVTVSAMGNGPLALALLALGCGGQRPLTVTAFPTGLYPGLVDGLTSLGCAIAIGP